MGCTKNNETLAEQMIPKKRRQLEMLLGRNSDIMIIWYCITGIEEVKAKEMNKKSSRKKRKRDDDEETEEETSEEEQGTLEEARYVTYCLNHFTISICGKTSQLVDNHVLFVVTGRKYH